MLAHGLEIGEDLAGVAVVGESVYHGDRAVFGERFDLRLLKGADHDPVEISRKDARGVLNGLSAPDLKIA